MRTPTEDELKELARFVGDEVGCPISLVKYHKTETQVLVGDKGLKEGSPRQMKAMILGISMGYRLHEA